MQKKRLKIGVRCDHKSPLLLMLKINRNLRSFRSLHAPSGPRGASTLVVAEHDNVNLSPSSLSTITAAKAIGGDITVLIMGHKVEEVAKVRQLISPRLFLYSLQ